MAKGIEVRTRADGSFAYRVRFRTEKGRQPTTETFNTLKEARKFKHLVDTIGGKAARELRDASDTQVAISTLADCLDAYITRVNSYASQGTGDDYKKVAKRTWLKFFNERTPVSALNKTAVEAWVTWQRAQITRLGNPYSAKSIRNAQGILSSVCEYAVEQGLISVNPAKGVKIPRDQMRKEKMFLNGEQIAAIMEHLPERFHPFITLLYSTGIRRGEALALTPADFDFESTPATVRIEKAFKQGKDKRPYLGSPKTKAGYRTIPIPNSVSVYLQDFIKTIPARDGLLFPAPTNPDKPMNMSAFLENYWHKAVEAAGIDGKPGLHDLRHSHASALIKRGIPLPVIQRRLGHESIKTTVDTYGHLAPESWAGAAEAIGMEFAPVLPDVLPPQQITAEVIVESE